MLGKKKRRIWLPLAVLLAGTVVAALDARLAVRHYRLETARVSVPVRIALLTDLHSCDYGEGQAGLLEAVAAEGPDVVLLGGDIVDDDARMTRAGLYGGVCPGRELAHLLCLGQPRVLERGGRRHQDRAGGTGRDRAGGSVRPRGRGRADHTALRRGRPRRRGRRSGAPSLRGPRRRPIQTFSPYC